MYRGRLLEVSATKENSEVVLLDGDSMSLTLRGKKVELLKINEKVCS
jgi:hypothetical protein